MRDPSTAMKGSMMTRTGSVSFMVLLKVRKCSEKVKGDRKVSPGMLLALLTRFRRRMRDGSPPTASMRGLIVSAAPSSGAIKTTVPETPGVPSGMSLPVVTRAARSRVSRDLPRPGSPSRVVNLPRGCVFPRASGAAQM